MAMKLYQTHEDGYTYYLGVDKEKKEFTVDSERGTHYRIGYITVDKTGYRAAFNPIFISPLNWKHVPWNF